MLLCLFKYDRVEGDWAWPIQVLVGVAVMFVCLFLWVLENILSALSLPGAGMYGVWQSSFGCGSRIMEVVVLVVTSETWDWGSDSEMAEITV